MTTAALYKWQFGNTKLHCPTCFDLNGQIHPLDAWRIRSCRLPPVRLPRSRQTPDQSSIPVQLVPGLGRTTESRPSHRQTTYYDAATGMRSTAGSAKQTSIHAPPFTAPAIAFRAKNAAIHHHRRASASLVPRPRPALDVLNQPAPATAPPSPRTSSERALDIQTSTRAQPPPQIVVYNERAAVQPVAPTIRVPPPKTPARSARKRYIAIWLNF